MHKRITNSEGASVSAQQSHFFSAHTRGFRGGYASSRHSLSVAPIASLPGKNGEMQRDFWYSSDAQCRRPGHRPRRWAATPPSARLSRLGSRKIPTTECPVLFESTLAAGLLGGFVQAVSGGALYRKSTFLLDSPGQADFPKHIRYRGRPLHPAAARAARPSTTKACDVQQRKVVESGPRAGLLPVQLLGAQAGHEHHGQRRWLAQPDDDAPSRTKPGDDLDAMLKKLGTGLFVVELMGQGVNYVTGDYSRGRLGFLGGERRDRLPRARDHHRRQPQRHVPRHRGRGRRRLQLRAKTVGSILINRMKVAGANALCAHQVPNCEPKACCIQHAFFLWQ